MNMAVLIASIKMEVSVRGTEGWGTLKMASKEALARMYQYSEATDQQKTETTMPFPWVSDDHVVGNGEDIKKAMRRHRDHPVISGGAAIPSRSGAKARV